MERITSDEIKALCKLQNSYLEFELFSEAFNCTIKHGIYCPIVNWETGEKITDKDLLITPYIVDCINSFLALDKSLFLKQLKEDLFRVFNVCIENTSYGAVPDELIDELGNTEANRKFFNGQNEDTLLAGCKFHTAWYDNDTAPIIAYSLDTKIDWDDEHGITIYFSNGLYESID